MKEFRGTMSVDGIEADGPVEGIIERTTPWASSFLMHAGLGLIGAFVVYAAMGPRTAPEKNYESLGVVDQVDPNQKLPTDLKDDALAKENVVRSAQDLLTNKVRGVDPFGARDSQTNTLKGMGVLEPTDVPFITTGPGASAGIGDGPTIGSGAGALAANGPLVVGTDKAGSVLGTTRAKRTVYILDHSGSMLDSYDYLREELKRATGEMIGAQQFSVIMVSERAETLGPEGLRRATPDAKREVANEIALTRAQGQNDGLLEPFKNGFEKAFALKPDLIIFLTDGNFDSRLVDLVKALNKPDAKGRQVQIQTIAYVQIDPMAAADLKKIAADSGGKYKFVREKDLQR